MTAYRDRMLAGVYDAKPSLGRSIGKASANFLGGSEIAKAVTKAQRAAKAKRSGNR